jgi:membrane protein required for colicin V production
VIASLPALKGHPVTSGKGVMNPLDILIIVIVGFCLVRGIFRGLIKELSSIVGVLGGFYGAYTYYPEVAKLLSRWISNTGYLNILSFLIIFLGVFLIIAIAGVVIKYLLKIVFLGWVDRICGAGFGFIKGILIVSVLVMVFTTFLPKKASIIKDSLLAPHVMLISENMAKIVPKDMKGQFREKIEELKSVWKT